MTYPPLNDEVPENFADQYTIVVLKCVLFYKIIIKDLRKCFIFHLLQSLQQTPLLICSNVSFTNLGIILNTGFIC